MASRNVLLIAAASMAVVVGALLPATARPENHVVGEQKWWAGPDVHVVGEMEGWTLGVNYADWARFNDGIPVGGKLEFIYDRAAHNVVLVNEDSYNRCIVPNNAPTWDDGDNILVLGNAGRYFFICGMADHCTRGMRFAITAI